MGKRHLITDTDDFTVTSFRKLPNASQREQAWLENRRKGVGGSDMSAIMGVNKYADAFDIWMEKTGRKTSEQTDSFSIRKGNAMEPVLRKWFNETHPELEMHDGTGYSLQSVQHPNMLASLDGYLYDPETNTYGILECKTASKYRSNEWVDEYGEPTIPVYYLVQVTHYMAVTGWTWGYVIADDSSPNPLIIRFDRDDDDIKAVVNAAEDFWGYVRRDEMPTLKTSYDVSTAFPQPSTDIIEGDEQTGELLKQYAELRDHIRELKRQQDHLKDLLCVQIGDNSGIRYGDMTATYKQYHRKAHMVSAVDGRRFNFSMSKKKEDA